MTSRDLQQTLLGDLQKSPRQIVIYLEGKTDVAPFFGLLGVAKPSGTEEVGYVHEGVLVRGLPSDGTVGSGKQRVAGLINVASDSKYPGFYGITDGDGRSLADLKSLFDAPFLGPLFSWKVYCIENLLAKAGWPPEWGATPDWSTELAKYSPYVALGRVFQQLEEARRAIGLQQRPSPNPEEPLKSSEDVIAALEKDKHLIQQFDAVTLYKSMVESFERASTESPDDAHAMLNGKWLIKHFAYIRAKKPTSHDWLRATWTEHTRSIGGLPEVRELWERITGAPP